MKKAITILLCFLIVVSVFGCSGEKTTLELNLDEASLGCLRLGMSFEDAKKSGVFDENDIELYNQDVNASLFSASVPAGKGVELLGEDCILDMYFIDGKMASATFNVNMYMDERNVDFSQRDEFFNEKSLLVENALRDTLGNPVYESKTALPGGIYPAEDDKEAVREMIYLIKDGKVIVTSEKIAGSRLIEYLKNTDFDYAVTSFCAKVPVFSEEDFDTVREGGIVYVQICSKEFHLLASESSGLQ